MSRNKKELTKRFHVVSSFIKFSWIIVPKSPHVSSSLLSRHTFDLHPLFGTFYDRQSDQSKESKAKRVVLDGEIAGLDEQDVPSFENLQNRKRCFIVYFAFDCLMLKGNDLINESLILRKGVRIN